MSTQWTASLRLLYAYILTKYLVCTQTKQLHGMMDKVALPPLAIHMPPAPAARRQIAGLPYQGFSPKNQRAFRERRVCCQQTRAAPTSARMRANGPPKLTKRSLSDTLAPQHVQHARSIGALRSCAPKGKVQAHPRPPRNPQEPSTADGIALTQAIRGGRIRSRCPSSSSSASSEHSGRGLSSAGSDAMSTLPEPSVISAVSTFRDCDSHADTHRGQRQNKSVRQMTTVELMTNPRGPVLDYSFLEIGDILELRSVAPRSGYRERPPATIETKDRHGNVLVVDNPLAKEWVPAPTGPGGQLLVTQGLKLSNNELASLPGATHIILREVLERSWLLRWIDLSFNNLEEIPEVLGSYLRLNTLYLHANRIASGSQVKSLAKLPNLHALTLHGNPCEEARHYKKVVLAHCTTLRKLDFSTVTKNDRELATIFAQRMASSSSKSVPPAPNHEEEEEETEVVGQLHHSGGLHTSASYAMSVAIAQGRERELQYGQLRV